MSLDLKLPNEQSFRFEGAKSLDLHARAWTIESPQYCVMGVHGYTEHSGCYRHFAEFLNARGCDLYWMDLPGHGESEGARSDIDEFSSYIESLERFVDEVNSRAKLKPRFLFAHSLGGLISLRFLETSTRASQLERVALSSPLLGLSENSFHGLGRFLQCQSGKNVLEFLTTVLPNITLPNEGDLGGSVLTHDEEMQRRRRRDPLMRSVVTTRWTREFLRARRKVFAEMDKIRIPLAIFQAGEDFVVSRKSTEDFFSCLPLKQKQLKIYEGLWHEIINEKERQQVMQDIAQWFQLEALAGGVEQASN